MLRQEPHGEWVVVAPWDFNDPVDLPVVLRDSDGNECRATVTLHLDTWVDSPTQTTTQD